MPELFPCEIGELTLAIARGYPFWTLLSSQIGGAIPGIKPAHPSSLISP